MLQGCPFSTSSETTLVVFTCLKKKKKRNKNYLYYGKVTREPRVLLSDSLGKLDYFSH